MDIRALVEVNSIGLQGTEPEVTDTGLKRLRDVLEDCSYIPIWKSAINSMLDYQGDHFGILRWKQAKQQALDVLEHRDFAAKLYVGAEDELKECGPEWHTVCEGITRKIRALERFTAVYDAQPLPSSSFRDPRPEPTYELEPLKDMKRGTRIVEAYPRTKDQVSI